MSDSLDPVNKVVILLASSPSVEDIMGYQATEAEEARLTQLSEKKHAGVLTLEEAEEIRNFELAEHMIRMAKLYALRQRA